jgi:hypothetical protein
MPGIISPLLRATLFGRLPDVRAKLDGEPPMPPGPLKTDRFRRVKTGRLGEPGMLVKAALVSENWGSAPKADGRGRRCTRMLDGNVPVVGVEGRTLTEECGERPRREPDVEDRPDGEASEALLVLEALEWEWW